MANSEDPDEMPHNFEIILKLGQHFWRSRLNVCFFLFLALMTILSERAELQGSRFFFKIGRPKQKMVGHFLKLWAQAYQTNCSWHLGSILNLHTDTETCMHICILTADYTVKPVLSGYWKKDQSLLNAGQKYCRMLQGDLH